MSLYQIGRASLSSYRDGYVYMCMPLLYLALLRCECVTLRLQGGGSGSVTRLDIEGSPTM